MHDSALACFTAAGFEIVLRKPARAAQTIGATLDQHYGDKTVAFAIITAAGPPPVAAVTGLNVVA